MLRFLAVILIFSLPACINNTRNNKIRNPENVYFDYKIKGDEKDSDVTVYLQYRMGGSDGSTILPGDSSKVMLDGEIIHTGNTKLMGTYYEIRKPAREFVGQHSISFIALNQKQYKEEFEYHPFSLKTKISSVIHRGDLIFNFEGLQPEDLLRVTITDTSFTSPDINEIDTIKKNKLIIPANKLKNLVNGPIILLLSNETERNAWNGGDERGRIVISYGLQREFELRD